jgi:hypothetical protein
MTVAHAKCDRTSMWCYGCRLSHAHKASAAGDGRSGESRNAACLTTQGPRRAGRVFLRPASRRARSTDTVAFISGPSARVPGPACPLRTTSRRLDHAERRDRSWAEPGASR